MNIHYWYHKIHLLGILELVLLQNSVGVNQDCFVFLQHTPMIVLDHLNLFFLSDVLYQKHSLAIVSIE